MARIGLIDADGMGYPNLALMKISAWHKTHGDTVEWYDSISGLIEPYDKVYSAKVFSDEYSQADDTVIYANEVVYGGTGLAITVENGREVFHADKHKNLPYEIEHMYPDYSLYPEQTKDKAIGFLTRGCPNACPFCIVSQKEGRQSIKVADLSEWWGGQKHIDLCDPNLLACRDRMELLQQLVDSGASVNFSQGLDARFMWEGVAKKINQIAMIDYLHFAFDLMKNEKEIIKGLKIAREMIDVDMRKSVVYMLTNYNTDINDDIYRINKIRECGFMPDVRIYRKGTEPKYTQDMQRWCNNRALYFKTDLMDYVPRKDGKTFLELYGNLIRDDLKGVRHEYLNRM